MMFFSLIASSSLFLMGLSSSLVSENTHHHPSEHGTYIQTHADAHAVFPRQATAFAGFHGHHLIISDECYQVDKEVAINAETGQPFYLVFVNNTNSNLGDGTFENPYQNLSAGDNPINAQDASSEGNIIYVFSGDDTTNHMNHGMTLKDFQKFLGSGVSHQFATTKGTVVVPAQTTKLPCITGTTSPAVVVCGVHSNEVSGFNISTTSVIDCITADPSIPGGFRGNVAITRNFLNAPPAAINVIDATLTDSPGAPTIILIDNNRMIGGRVGSGYNNTTNPSTGIIVTNNTSYHSGGGLVFAQTGGGSIGSALVCGNEVHGMPTTTAEVAIGFNSNTNGLFSIKVLNNNIHDNGTIGISLQKDPAISHGAIQLEIEGNTLTNNTKGVQITTDSATTSICARLVNNVATNNGGDDYVITNMTGTLRLEPPDDNVGVITTTGAVEFVPICSCNVCP